MPSTCEHKEQYLHNKRLIESAGFRCNFADWFITALFYGAIHLVECELAQKGDGWHTTNHDMRRNAIAREQTLKPVLSAYITLHNESVRARYGCVAFTPQDLKTAEEKFKEIETHLLGSIKQ